MYNGATRRVSLFCRRRRCRRRRCRRCCCHPAFRVTRIYKWFIDEKRNSFRFCFRLQLRRVGRPLLTLWQLYRPDHTAKQGARCLWRELLWAETSPHNSRIKLSKLAHKYLNLYVRLYCKLLNELASKDSWLSTDLWCFFACFRFLGHHLFWHWTLRRVTHATRLPAAAASLK